MADLREDLRRYFDRVTDEVRSGKSAPAPPAETRSRRVRWLVAAAIVAVVAIVTSVAVTDSQDRTEHVRTDVMATPEQIRTGWERIPNAFPQNAFVNDLGSGPAGFIAVGHTFGPNGSASDPTRPGIWYSADGRTWSLAAMSSVGAETGEVVSAAYWRDAYYALVNASDGTSLWKSPDTQTWTRFASAPSLPGGNLTRLYADDTQMIAFGLDGVWSTGDGSNWSAGDLDEMVVGMTRAGDRLLALTGRSATSGTTSVFESNNGLDWTLDRDLSREADPGGSAIVSWDAATWVATYPGPPTGRSTLWATNRDRRWEQVDADNPSDSGFDRLTAIGPYLVATGFDSDSRPGGWVSTDGQDWISMPDLDRPPGGRLNLSTSDGRIVVAASTSELRDVYLWREPVSSSTSSTTASHADAPPTQPVDVTPTTDDPTSGSPARLGPNVVVVEGSSESEVWALSVYPSTIGLCVELRRGPFGGGSCGPLNASAINTAYTSGIDGQWVFGYAPLRTTHVRVVFTDGTTASIPAAASPEYGLSFFVGEIDRDRAVERTDAIGSDGVQLATQSIPPDLAQ